MSHGWVSSGEGGPLPSPPVPSIGSALTAHWRAQAPLGPHSPLVLVGQGEVRGDNWLQTDV